MKSLLSIFAAIAVGALSACSQDPRMAALEQQMRTEMEQMIASGASPAEISAYQAAMMDQAQSLRASIASSKLGGMNAGGYPEPTEAEMRSVFEGTLNNVKERVDGMANQCNNVRNTNDPAVGIACLMGMVGQSQSAQVGLSSFEKIACEKASRPGYNCDYVIGVSARALDAFGGGGREAQTKRFVKSDGRWIAMEY